MGKQGWQKQWGQPQSYSHYAGSYSQQAWGQNQWKSQGQNGSQGQHGAMKNLAEVPYSQVKVKEEDAAKPAAVAGDGELQKSLAQLAQRAVNQARRAAAKSKKAQEDLNNCQKAWTEYQRQMKEAFLRQHEQFQQDQEYYEAEIVKAKDAEKAAEDRLKEVLADNQVEPMMEEELREAAVEDDPWENLFKGVPKSQHQGPEVLTDARLAQYLQMSMKAVQSTAQASTDKMMTAMAPNPELTSMPAGIGFAGAEAPTGIAPHVGAADPHAALLAAGGEGPPRPAAPKGTAMPITPPRKGPTAAKRTPVKEMGRGVARHQLWPGREALMAAKRDRLLAATTNAVAGKELIDLEREEFSEEDLTLSHLSREEDLD